MLISFYRSVVSDQCSISYSNAIVRFWLKADVFERHGEGLLLT